MGSKVPTVPPYVGSMWKGVQDFGKPRRASNSSASDECFDPLVKQADVSSTPLPARLPAFHESELGPWCAVISYDACVRLCLKHWSKGSRGSPPLLRERMFAPSKCFLFGPSSITTRGRVIEQKVFRVSSSGS